MPRSTRYTTRQRAAVLACLKERTGQYLGVQDVADAVKKLGIEIGKGAPPTACRCGEVITGRMPPEGCPLFGKMCTPEDPVGPCMVSSEGACAAAYKYREC